MRGPSRPSSEKNGDVGRDPSIVTVPAERVDVGEAVGPAVRRAGEIDERGGDCAVRERYHRDAARVAEDERLRRRVEHRRRERREEELPRELEIAERARVDSGRVGSFVSKATCSGSSGGSACDVRSS